MVFFLQSIGMERYKLPVGRLATVFYKGEVDDSKRKQGSPAWDSEKGLLGSETTLPQSDLSRMTTVSKEEVAPQVISSHNGRNLAWKGLSLELKVGDEVKRLLDDISGRF